jgi:hypothetical protein
MKKLIATKAIILLAVLAVIALSSCSSRKGYGCRGNESWNHMIKRINNGY